MYGQHSWEKNLLRHHIGGRVFNGADDDSWNIDRVLDEATNSSRALISDDPTVPVIVPEGGRDYDFSFGQRFLLRRVTYMSEELVGGVDVFVAATDPIDANGRWVKIASQEINSEQREQIIKFAAVDARYLRLKVRTKQEGRIFGLGAFGIRKAVEFYSPAERGVLEDPLESIAAASAGDVEEVVDIDETAQPVMVESLNSSATNAMGFARVEMVSSSADGDIALAATILDEDSTSQYHFAPDDQSPTAVIDLGKSCDCGRVSVLYKTGEAGAMTMWLADPRPAGAVSTRGETFRVGESLLQVKLKRTVDDFEGEGRISFNKFRRAGRYLILKWEAAVAESPDPAAGFGLNEIAVFEHFEDKGELERVTVARQDLRELVVPTPEARQVVGRQGGLQGGGNSSGLQASPVEPAEAAQPAPIIILNDEPVSR